MALTDCHECGEKVSTEATACPHCGAPQRQTPALPPVITTQRTESVVVSVSPNYENEKVAELAKFGWNLKSSQEVIGHLREAENPDTLGASIWRGALEGATGTKTLEYDHYSKLHFVRDSLIPNLDKIRELEDQYFSLSYPEFPRLAPGGIFLLLLFWYPFWPLWYFFGYKPRKAAAEARLAEIVKRRQEILAEVAKWLQN